MEEPDGSTTPPIKYTRSPSAERSRPDLVWRERIINFYKKWNPTKVPEVDSILAAHRGAEAEVYAAIVDKYVPKDMPKGKGKGKFSSSKRKSRSASPSCSPVAVPILRKIAKPQQPPTSPNRLRLTRDPVTGRPVGRRRTEAGTPPPFALPPPATPPVPATPASEPAVFTPDIHSVPTPESMSAPTPTSMPATTPPHELNEQLSAVMTMLQEQKSLFEKLREPDNGVHRLVEEMQKKMEKETERSERLERELRDLKELWRERCKRPEYDEPPSRGVSVEGVLDSGCCEPRELSLSLEPVDPIKSEGVVHQSLAENSPSPVPVREAAPENGIPEKEEADDVTKLEEAVHMLGAQIRGINMVSVSPKRSLQRRPGVTTVDQLLADDSDGDSLPSSRSGSDSSDAQFGQHDILPGRVVLS